MREIKEGQMFRWMLSDQTYAGAVVMKSLDEDFCQVVVLQTQDPHMAGIAKAISEGPVSKDYMAQLRYIGEVSAVARKGIVFGLME